MPETRSDSAYTPCVVKSFLALCVILVPATASAFCEGEGLDYVSCSPWRVPIARLAAAQAALKRK